MKLGTKGRYAVMAMVDLGLHSRADVPVTLADIATRQEISLSYLEQLFAKLRRAGLVHSVRGPGGGYILSRGAEHISVADIIRAVEEDLDVTRCQNRLETGCMVDKSQCLTHDLWAAMGEHLRIFLSGVSIADVCARRIPRKTI
jgi:Rrf2 family transcriptional regulator, iron-sulfur cluster assembly transcription factor